MQFNPDPNKQTNAVIFCRWSNSNFLIHLVNSVRTILLNALIRNIVLDSKLNFNTRIDQKPKKCNKLIGLIKRLSVNLPRSVLLIIYKSFIRPHLEHGDILHNKPDNKSFLNKIKKVQYNACLTITDAIQETSRENLYEDLGLHSLA